MTETKTEALVADGLGRLAAQAADLPPHLGDDIRDPRQVLVGQRQLAEGLAPLALVARDAGGFFEDGPALLRLRGKHLVDLPLRHDRVRRAAHARVHEKLGDVLEAARLAVDQIVALPVPRGAPHDLDLMKIDAELLLAFAQEEGDFAQILRPPRLGALENDVLHPAPAEGLGALFAENPADRVGDIALAAAIGADDGRDAGFEAENRGISERLEAVKLERLKVHAT